MADLNSNQIPIYATTPSTTVGTLSAASAGALGTSTNAVTVCTAGSNGAIITALVASTTDTAAVNLYIQIQRTGGGSISPIAQVNVPLRSGDTASTLMTDCLNSSVAVGLPIDNTGKRCIILGPSDLLIVSVVANMTAAKTCYVSATMLNI